MLCYKISKSFYLAKNRLVGLFTIAVLFGTSAHAIDRIVAYHDTILCVNEQALTPGIVTYPVHQHHWLHQQILGKALISLKSGEQVHPFDKLPNSELKLNPWGFKLLGTVDGTHIDMDYFPILHGRDTSQREGIAALRIATQRTRPGDVVRCEYGGLQLGDFINPAKRIALLSASDFPGSADDEASLHGDITYLTSPDLPLTVGLKALSADGAVECTPNTQRHTLEVAWTPDSQDQAVCWILIAFAPDRDRIPELIQVEPATEFQKTKTYFEQAATRVVIDTPVDSIDQAFQWGLLNLEYCYYQPLGWIESLDHWITLYSMMYPRAADALGQFERSRDCLLAHAQGIGPTGRLRDLDPSGRARDDFMWNHHFIWDIEHYLDWTGDVETIRKLYPAAQQAVDFVFETYDHDGNLLIGFDQQIGYQEDQIWTPHDGGSASISAVELLRIMSKLATAIGAPEEASTYAEQATTARANLRRELWSRELGSYINFRDPYGVPHWMGQYHTYVWPAIYSLADPFECYTSARHVVDNLTSPRGLVYVSKNFPAHQAHTTGCQEGAPQAPVAAWGLNAAGLYDEGAAMFRAFAELVMSPKNRGCFPETAALDGTWFSPTASFYVESIVAGLFGISCKQGQWIITPMIPDSWESASIQLPALALKIKNDGELRRLQLTFTDPRPVKLKYRLPPADKYAVSVNGKPVNPSFVPGIGGVIMVLDLPAKKHYEIEVRSRAVEIAVHHPTNVAEGQDFTCRIESPLKLTGVNDPQGIIRSLRISEGRLDATLRDDVVTPFYKFGELGRRHFSRRTVFLELRSAEHLLHWPINLMVTSNDASISTPKVAEYSGVHTPQSATPIEFTRPDSSKDWLSFRLFDDLAHMGLHVLEDPLASLVALAKQQPGASDGDTESQTLILQSAQTNHIPFQLQPERLLVLSDFMNRPSATLQIDQDVSALHFLVLPFLTNEDTYSEIAEIIVRCAEGPPVQGVAPVDRRTLRRVLCHPGDLDNWYPASRSHGYHSVGNGWTTSPAISTDSATFNLITVDLGQQTHVDTVTLRTIGRYPAMGLVAITGTQTATPTTQVMNPQQGTN